MLERVDVFKDEPYNTILALLTCLSSRRHSGIGFNNSYTASDKGRWCKVWRNWECMLVLC